VNMRALSSVWRAVKVAVVLGAGAAFGQGGDAPAPLQFDILVGGNTVGEAGMALVREEDGTRSHGTAKVASGFDLSDVLVTDATGAAKSYHLQGTVHGTEVVIDVTFSATSADFAIEQGGQKQNVSLPLTGPVHVLDNNFIDGYQVLVDQVLKDGVGKTFDIIVPQVAMLGTFELAAPVDDTVSYGGEDVRVRRLGGTLRVGPQSIDAAAYVDDGGDILVLTTTPGNVRMERRQAGEASGAAATTVGSDRAGVTAALAAAAPCLVERELSVSSTGATLVGKLTLPKAAADGSGPAAPTLLLLPGSGAADLDGNAPPLLTNSGYEQLAYGLACRGFGVLRASKLGVPPSTGDGNAVTIETYAQNAADWLAALTRQQGVDARRLGLIGHSEGGIIALYATARGYVSPRALVLIAAPGRPLDVLAREQLLEGDKRSGATEEQLATLGRQIDEAFAAIKSSSGTALKPTPELADNPVAAMFAHAAGLLRSEFAVDPQVAARGVEVPVAVIQGRKDLLVKVTDAELLAAGAPHATLFLLDDLTHNLVDTAGPAASLPLPGPDAVISPTLVQVIATYLAGNLHRGP